MNKVFKTALILAAAILLVSCNRNPLKINISDISEEVKIIRYEKELQSLGGAPSLLELKNLREKYPEFTDLFTGQIIRTGPPDEGEGADFMRAFLNDTMISSVFQMVNTQFAGFENIENKLIRAFKHYRHYFPGKPLPDIYTCISGFNESAFAAEGMAGISLDKYLGPLNAYYPSLGFPKYKQRKMIPEMIPADVMYVWAMGEYEIGENATTLLDHMVHEGKLLYFLEAMMPFEHDSLLTGFTSAQLKWCRNNEAQMWTYLIDNELLYSTKQMDITRYLNDGPQTNGFPPESPGRTGAWLGRQIIRKYMKQYPEITLEKLMGNNNYQQILNESAYLP